MPFLFVDDICLTPGCFPLGELDGGQISNLCSAACAITSRRFRFRDNQMYLYAAFESFSVPSDFVLGLHLLFS